MTPLIPFEEVMLEPNRSHAERLFALVKKKADEQQAKEASTAAPSPVVEALKKLQPDNLSPRQALEELYRLKQLAERPE